MDRRAQELLQTTNPYVRATMQGLTFGLEDELGAGIQTVTGQGNGYDFNLAASREGDGSRSYTEPGRHGWRGNLRCAAHGPADARCSGCAGCGLGRTRRQCCGFWGRLQEPPTVPAQAKSWRTVPWGAAKGALYGGGSRAALSPGRRCRHRWRQGYRPSGCRAAAWRARSRCRGHAPALGWRSRLMLSDPMTARSGLEAARTSGSPAVVADFGGETTRALARSSANTAPEASRGACGGYAAAFRRAGRPHR